ncbi:MAG: DUF2971 domain-containing protein [Sphingomonas sp.]
MFEEQVASLDLDETLRNALSEAGLGGLSTEDAKAIIMALSGTSFESLTRMSVEAALQDRVIPFLNSPETIDNLLTKVAQNLICLSLSDNPHSSPMWAHYAGNSSGFAIAFDTASSFFRRGETG